jgi:hypothetical protein
VRVHLPCRLSPAPARLLYASVKRSGAARIEEPDGRSGVSPDGANLWCNLLATYQDVMTSNHNRTGLAVLYTPATFDPASPGSLGPADVGLHG